MSLEHERDYRQRVILDWVKRMWGQAAMTAVERALRVVEEAIELCQAVGVSPDVVHKLVDHVYRKPAGKVEQEIGGITITLLAFAALHGISAEKCERDELRRILDLPREHFFKRQQIKAEAGVAVEPSEE